MTKQAAIKQFAQLLGISIHQAARLVKLSEEAERAQTDWHNGDAKEEAAEQSCNAFEVAAGKLGFECEWPGMFPLLNREGRSFSLPDWDDERQTVEDGDVTKWFSYTVQDVDYHHEAGTDGTWHHADTIDHEADEDGEKYDHKLNTISDIFDDLLRFVPGLEEYDWYGSFSLKVNLRELDEAGWDELTLRCFVEGVGDHIAEGKPLQTECEPYLYETTDAYGNKINVWRFPGFIVPEILSMEGMEFEEQTSSSI